MRALRSATATLGLGSLHQKPRVGGTLGGSLRDGSDGWRSPVPRGDNTGGEFFYRFRQPSFVGPADWSRASRRMVDSVQHGWSCTFRRVQFPGCNVFVRRCGVLVASCCGSGSPLGLDVEASMILSVAATEVHVCTDVAASPCLPSSCTRQAL